MAREEVKIPSKEVVVEEAVVEEQVVSEEQVEQVEEEEKLTREEAEYIKKVFFEDDDKITLRDGRTYRIPPLSLKDGLKLMDKLNGIDTSVIVLNLIDDGSGNSRYDLLIEVLLMAFKPYYPEITTDYVSEYVDLNTAKEILDIMIGLNQIKKNM